MGLLTATAKFVAPMKMTVCETVFQVRFTGLENENEKGYRKSEWWVLNEVKQTAEVKKAFKNGFLMVEDKNRWTLRQASFWPAGPDPAYEHPGVGPHETDVYFSIISIN